MNRIHSTNIDNVNNFNKKYKYPHNNYYDYKPNGLWYGFSNDYKSNWVNWITKNNYNTLNYKHHYLLNIHDLKILKLNNYDSVIKFINNFSYPLEDEFTELSAINWNKVKKNWNGIEFIFDDNLFNRLKKEYMWIETLEINSGCLWNLNNLININKI